jgi:hypothetical protein
MAATDPVTAWVTASRNEELGAWRALYDALHPAPTSQTRGGGLAPGSSAPRRVPVSTAARVSNTRLHSQPPAGRDARVTALVTAAPRRAATSQIASKS